ncbi:MAG TPA: hypothetical protein PKL14_09575 [Holophaga sp.]|jgi:hypothetical protein|nr:hypothetical protein [Holophaga sp.]
MISIGEAFSSAIARTKRILFQPFDAGKWFTLGFCAFLANLCSGGGGGGGSRFNVPTGGGNTGSSGGPEFDACARWVMGHLPLVITLGVLLAMFVITLMVVFQWLGSRGAFMFLDGVIRDRGSVVEPWHRFQKPGNNLFLFRLLLGLATLVLLALIAALALGLAWHDLRSRHFGAGAVVALATGLPLFILWALGASLLDQVLTDFVVPIMYRRGISTMSALRVWWRELVPGHGWEFVSFYLLKLALALAAFIAILLGTCCTCCLAALPYIGTVFFLPLYVFFRCYSLGFLEQFGEEWTQTPVED